MKSVCYHKIIIPGSSSGPEKAIYLQSEVRIKHIIDVFHKLWGFISRQELGAGENSIIILWWYILPYTWIFVSGGCCLVLTVSPPSLVLLTVLRGVLVWPELPLPPPHCSPHTWFKRRDTEQIHCHWNMFCHQEYSVGSGDLDLIIEAAITSPVSDEDPI